MDNFNVIYKILRTLEAALDYDDFDPAEAITPESLNITRSRFYALILMMVDEGYVKGVTRTILMNHTAVNISRMSITLKGLEYLHENSLMQKVARAAKGIKDSIPGL